MTREEALALRDQAETHAENIRLDLVNASTRLEHIRLTQHQAEALALVAAIDILLAPDGPENSYLPTHY